MDLRAERLTFEEVEPLPEAGLFYRRNKLDLIIVDVRGHEPLPVQVETFVGVIEAQAAAHGLRVKILRDDPQT